MSGLSALHTKTSTWRLCVCEVSGIPSCMPREQRELRQDPNLAEAVFGCPARHYQNESRVASRRIAGCPVLWRCRVCLTCPLLPRADSDTAEPHCAMEAHLAGLILPARHTSSVTTPRVRMLADFELFPCTKWSKICLA